MRRDETTRKKTIRSAVGAVAASHHPCMLSWGILEDFWGWQKIQTLPSLSIYIFIDVLGDILVVVMFVRLKVTYLTFFGVILTPFLSLHISTTSLSYCTAISTRRRFLMSIYGTQWCSSEREFRQNLNFDKGKCLHMGWITLHESRNLTLI